MTLRHKRMSTTQTPLNTAITQDMRITIKTIIDPKCMPATEHSTEPHLLGLHTLRGTHEVAPTLPLLRMVPMQ